MNRLSIIFRQKLISIIFIIISLIGGFLIFLYINNLKTENSNALDYQEIFIAKDTIKKGDTISEDLIEKQKIPRDIFSSKFVTNKAEVIGQKAIQEILKGEIVSKDKIEVTDSSSDSHFRFSSYIPYGLRAVSVPVNCYGDLSLVKVGDKVDIISTYYDEVSSKVEAETILSGKEIILIEDSFRGKSSGEQSASANSDENLLLDTVFSNSAQEEGFIHFFTITFYLNPEEVGLIFLSLERGVLYLSICPPG